MNMEFFEIIVTGAITPILILCIKNAWDSRKVRLATEEQRENLREWLETLQCEVNDLKGMMERQIKQSSNEVKAAKARSRVIIHDRLSQAHRFYMEQGYIEYDSAQALSAMYDVYHNECGGNGYAEKLINEIKTLPLRD